MPPPAWQPQPPVPPPGPPVPPPAATPPPVPPPNPRNPQRRQRQPNAAADTGSDVIELPDEADEDVGYGRAPNPCKVSRFKDTTTGVIIESWFYQMEDYMELHGVPRGHWVKTCIANFNSQHYDQVRCHRYLPYAEFKKKVIEIFKRPDMTQYKIKELWTIQQYEDEGPDAFMTRIRALAREAFRKLPDEEQQVMTVHSLLRMVERPRGSSVGCYPSQKFIGQSCENCHRSHCCQ